MSPFNSNTAALVRSFSLFRFLKKSSPRYHTSHSSGIHALSSVNFPLYCITPTLPSLSQSSSVAPADTQANPSAPSAIHPEPELRFLSSQRLAC